MIRSRFGFLLFVAFCFVGQICLFQNFGALGVKEQGLLGVGPNGYLPPSRVVHKRVMPANWVAPDWESLPTDYTWMGGSVKYTDPSQFAKATLNESPFYQRLRNNIEVTDSSDVIAPVCNAPVKDCEAEAKRQSELAAQEKTSSVRWKLDPLKVKAGFTYNGIVRADMFVDKSSMQIRVKKPLDRNSEINVNMDTKDEKGLVEYRYNF